MFEFKFEKKGDSKIVIHCVFFPLSILDFDFFPLLKLKDLENMFSTCFWLVGPRPTSLFGSVVELTFSTAFSIFHEFSISVKTRNSPLQPSLSSFQLFYTQQDELGNSLTHRLNSVRKGCWLLPWFKLPSVRFDFLKIISPSRYDRTRFGILACIIRWFDQWPTNWFPYGKMG